MVSCLPGSDRALKPLGFITQSWRKHAPLGVVDRDGSKDRPEGSSTALQEELQQAKDCTVAVWKQVASSEEKHNLGISP